MLTEEQKHQTKFFIKKFEATKEEEWCVGSVNGLNKTHCALGHLGMTSSKITNLDTQAFALESLLNCITYSSNISSCNTVTGINDKLFKEYQQPTPRQRVLAALYDLLKL